MENSNTLTQSNSVCGHENFYTRATRITYAILRVTAGLFFMQSGGVKLLGWFGGINGQGATVELMSLIGVAGVLELVGGTMIALGLLTRPVAFLLSGEMAVAYFMGHFPNGFWPIQNQGLPAVLYCFIFLYIAAHGAGIFSLDRLIGCHRKKACS
ncbi:MAG: DoxX family protein [bacterium]|nr:DoxX family protein [bacterium]